MLLSSESDGGTTAPPKPKQSKRKDPPVEGILDRITAELKAQGARAVEVAPFGHGAGHGAVNDGPGDLAVLPETMLRQLAGGRTPGRVVVSFVRGDSMLPYLIAGTPILIEEMTDFIEGGRYAIWYGSRDEDEIKRVERIGEKRIRISSDNKMFQPRVYEHVEEDMYREVPSGHVERIRVRGMIFFPPDMAAAVVGQIAEFSANLIDRLTSR